MVLSFVPTISIGPTIQARREKKRVASNASKSVQSLSLAHIFMSKNVPFSYSSALSCQMHSIWTLFLMPYTVKTFYRRIS